MDEKQQLLNDITAKVKAELSTYASKGDLEIALKAATTELKEQFKGMNDLETKLASIEKAAIAQGEMLSKMKNSEPSQPQTIKAQLEANSANIKKLLAGDYTAKTTIIPTAITNNFNGQIIPGIGKLPYRNNMLRPTLNQSPIAANNQLTLRYMDQTANTNNAAARTVGNIAAEGVMTWQGYNLNIERYSQMIPVALEMLEDFDFIQNEIQTNLLRNLDLAIESAILNGTGNTPQIAGILGATHYTAFTAPTGLAGTVKKANIMDVIMTASAIVSHNSQYQANYVWMNDFDAMQLQLQKDDEGRYLFPNFISANGMMVGNIKIIPTSLVTANTMFIGDFSYSTLYSKGATITIGTNADDFSHRRVTLLVNEPVALLTKALDLQSISYVSDITAAIATINTGA